MDKIFNLIKGRFNLTNFLGSRGMDYLDYVEDDGHRVQRIRFVADRADPLNHFTNFEIILGSTRSLQRT